MAQGGRMFQEQLTRLKPVFGMEAKAQGRTDDRFGGLS